MNDKVERLGFGVDEVAQRLGISVSSVRKHIRDGKLSARKLGGRTVILTADLNSFLDGLSPAKVA